MNSPGRSDREKILYPGGTEFDQHRLDVLMEQYKILVETSESLVARRQNVNTFFLSVNALSLSAMGVVIGLISRDVVEEKVAVAGIIAIAVAGIFLCIAWRNLVHSYGQLNKGKFAILHLIEIYLPAAVFTAEWAALEEGKNPKVYKSFTGTEKMVPLIISLVYVIALVIGAVLLFCQVEIEGLSRIGHIN